MNDRAPPGSVVAIVPAAGLGDRLGMGPKAFLKIGGKTLISHVAEILRPCVNRLIIALPDACMGMAEAHLSEIAEIYPGSKSRHTTIESMLPLCREDIVVVHDLSRPFASRDLLRRVIDAAQKEGAAVTCSELRNPVSRCAHGYVVDALPATDLRQCQTPLAFGREILESAYQMARSREIETPTTYELMLMLGVPVVAVEGEESNIKVATHFEWEVANALDWKRILGQKQ